MPAVLYETRDRIAFITLNRPEVLNAFNREMHQQLREAWLAFREDDDVWVAVVTGAGDRAFSAGADIKEMGQRREEPVRRSFWETWFGDDLQTGLDVWKPTIAAINGYCLGEGLTLILACDFRIASERASFGFPEVNLGIPTIVGAIRAPHVVGLGNALALLLIGCLPATYPLTPGTNLVTIAPAADVQARYGGPKRIHGFAYVNRDPCEIVISPERLHTSTFNEEWAHGMDEDFRHE